jgi:hypothetical protein
MICHGNVRLAPKEDVSGLDKIFYVLQRYELCRLHLSMIGWDLDEQEGPSWRSHGISGVDTY